MVRVTGPLCRNLLLGGLRVKKPVARRASLGNWHAATGEFLDEVLWTFFQGPGSYTGEDVLEISLHGNPYILQRVLDDLCARGARLADPGEFTRRAFLNGKMDLSQAEAVADLIHARSDMALQAARAQREGAISREMAARCEDLLETIAWLEAYIDFPDEDLPYPDFAVPAGQLELLEKRLKRLLESEERGRFLREGVSVVLVGEPNAGKSSLLNALLRRERVLVSSTPGTTRDYVTEEVRIGDYCIQITDTAGLRGESEDPLERLGMQATLRQVQEADLILWVVDASQPRSADWQQVRDHLQNTPWFWVLNKTDLPLHAEWEALQQQENGGVALSALQGEGLPQLEKTLLDWIENRLPPPLPEQILLNARHAQALRAACAQLEVCRQTLLEGDSAELVVEDLRAVLEYFEEVVGQVDNERMLDKLFANFCIGK